jgi:hypothetical protein
VQRETVAFIAEMDLGRDGAKANIRFAGGPAVHAIVMNRRAFLQTGTCAMVGAFGPCARSRRS